MTSRNILSIKKKPTCAKNSDFMSKLCSKLDRLQKKQKIEIEFAFPSMIFRLENATNHNLHKKFLKM